MVEVKKAALEDRSGEFTGQRMASGLLDYQDSAVKFLSRNLANPGGRALLALDTGLGKSAVVKAVVDQHWKQMGPPLHRHRSVHPCGPNGEDLDILAVGEAAADLGRSRVQVKEKVSGRQGPACDSWAAGFQGISGRST